MFPAYSGAKGFEWAGNMKKRGFLWMLMLVLGITSICPVTVLAAQPNIEITAPSAVLLEASTGKILFEKEAEEERSPASITKIMTLFLIFEALDEGKITLEEETVTSAYAKSMGGSQVYLEEGEKQTVETLIKCIVVSSGNDASVVMAEHLAGSEGEFVKSMNQKAKELGMTHTRFEDCCGLTDAEGHYTTAKDVAIVSRALITKYPEVLEYSSIWMDEIVHKTARGESAFGLTNTNKMIRSYEGCIGLKTGSTSKAKYCVSSVAKRDEITLIAVVMGAENPKSRFQDAETLFNYGFGVTQLYVDEAEERLDPVVVKGGVKEQVSCEYKENFQYLDTEGKNLNTIEKKIIYQEEVAAPVRKGSCVGEIQYFLDGERIGTIELISQETVEKATFWDMIKKVGIKWKQGFTER